MEGRSKEGWRKKRKKAIMTEGKQKNETWKKGGNESNMEVKVKKSKKTVEIVNKCPVTVLCTFGRSTSVTKMCPSQFCRL